MQRGLATLEIIFAVMIIAVLANFAVPNAARIVDRAALDYETKRLYSELRFVQSMNRSSTIKDTGTGNTKNIKSDGNKLVLIIESSQKSYQVFRGNDNKNAIREPHYLANGITLSFKRAVSQNMITFDESGKSNLSSNTLILTSRLDNTKYIKFDSVGRIRADLTDD